MAFEEWGKKSIRAEMLSGLEKKKAREMQKL